MNNLTLITARSFSVRSAQAAAGVGVDRDRQLADTPIDCAQACNFANKSGNSIILKGQDLRSDLQICPLRAKHIGEV